jgi:acetate kinase
VDDALLTAVRSVTDLAPLHLPPALHLVELLREWLPDVPQVLCPDTGFHADLPEHAATYPLPAAWRDRYGLRRYGFHGLSYAWATRRAAQLLDRSVVDLRLVLAHLGGGASVCAVWGGRSVDTSMGFTPLDGVPMSTRSGAVDPGMLLWLADRTELTPGQISTALEHESGLLALAGTADMREVIAGADKGDARAVLALDVYVHRLRGAVAVMAASLGGLDVLVFTGGVGEHSAAVRARVCEGLAFLGIELDPSANEAPELDADIGADGAAVRTFAVRSREDLQIARGVRAVLA